MGARPTHHSQLDEQSIRTDTPSFETGSNSAISILANARATALICGGFELSNGALDVCQRRGLSLPQDIAFVGYGDPSLYEWIAGDITTIALPVEALAKQAVDMIISWGEEAEDRFVTLPAKRMIRQSA